MKEEVYIITGMHCAACSSSVERVTRKLAGVERSDVNLMTNRMTISYDPGQVTPETIMSKVQKAGFGIRPFNDTPKAESTKEDEGEVALRRQKRDMIGTLVFAALVSLISMGHMFGMPLPRFIDPAVSPVNYALIQMLLCIPALLFGRRFFIGGFGSLIRLNPNMDSLVAVSSSCSYIYSIVVTFVISFDPGWVHQLYYESAVMVLGLVMLGKFLEERSKQRTKGAIAGLMALTPDTAFIVTDDVVNEIPSDALQKGDLVLVKTGGRIPADGIVERGSGAANEAMLTGESLPVEKEVGSRVIGGSILSGGTVYVRVDRVGAESTLAGIIRLMEDAQGKKAPVSRLADKVAGVFVPVIIGISSLAGLIWALCGADIAFVVRVFTSILVIACPCALGLATPTAIMVGTGLGAKYGILVKSGEALELIGKADTVVLDKTGTITTGQPQVTEVLEAAAGRDELLAMAAAAEAMSAHPLSKAVLAAAEGIEPVKLQDFEELAGMGIKAVIEDRGTLLVGSRGMMRREGIDESALTAELDRLSGMGRTPILVALDGVLQGAIMAADTIRDTSRAAIERMKTMGVRVVLLTGDNKGAAEYVADAVGADEAIAEVLPGEKAQVISRLKAEGRRVVMVGDGINDAVALTEADIGVAIGAGSDVAVDSADVVLMRSDLMDIPRALRLSRLTLTDVKENLFWAFFYNVICIPVAAGALYPAFGILLTPMIGSFAMSLSSICVVSNALRLRFKKL